jgi:hypothetical protein
MVLALVRHDEARAMAEKSERVRQVRRIQHGGVERVRGKSNGHIISSERGVCEEGAMDISLPGKERVWKHESMNIPIAIICRCLAFSLLCSLGAATCSWNSCFSSSPECMDFPEVLMSVETVSTFSGFEAEVTSAMGS